MKKCLGLGRTACFGAMLVFALVMSACKPSTLVSSLGAVLSAAEFALPVIASAAGIPPQVTAAIVSYLQLVDAATAQASTILAGPGTSAEKSAAIIAAFANLAQGCNCLPAGTPQEIVKVLDGVAQAIAKFLVNFSSKGILPTAKAAPIKVSVSDRAALADIRNRAEQHAAKVKAVLK